MKIITNCFPMPIASRNLDWQAYLDYYEVGDPVGYGPTEEAAIEDLKNKIEEERAAA